MRRVDRSQRIRYTVEADVRANAAFESTPMDEVADAADREGQHGIFGFGRGAVDDAIGLKEGSLDLHRFKTSVQRTRVDMARAFDEERIAPSVSRAVAAERSGHRRKGVPVGSRPRG